MPPLKKYEFESDTNPLSIITIWAYNEDSARSKLNRISITVSDFELITN